MPAASYIGDQSFVLEMVEDSWNMESARCCSPVDAIDSQVCVPCCRLYRKGEDLREIRRGDRGWKLSAEESAVLKEILPQGSYKHREHC